jgi:glucose/arabinose dehydrogenase
MTTIPKYMLFLLGGAILNCGSGNSNSTSLPVDNDISLPNGFKAETVVESLGNVRHIAVNSNGDVYVKLERLKDGKGIYMLRETGGKYGVVKSFGNYGGTGIAIKNGYLYASSNSDVYRYKLVNNEVTDPDNPEKIIAGLVDGGMHNSKSIALDNAGNIYVNVGAPSNACQAKDRSKGSPGLDPCPLLEKAAAIWQFKANKLNQTYDDGVRYCTGIRNIVGLDWNSSVNQLFALMHGRDQLHDLFPEMFTSEQSAELPAEEFLEVKKGSDFGWPYCYYDQLQKKKVLSPEYGGDGKKEDRCAGKDKPIMGFPGHWAPDGLLFYTGKMFPAKYRNGAFIAFHGSWNRSPLQQAGYNVVFVPFKNGKPSGDYEVFADGFIGADKIMGSAQAKHRPCGLAQGADGALYVTDDKGGKIWKIVYGK